MREWLKNLRMKKNLTMKEAGERLGVSESYYCAIENGTRQKKMDVVLACGIARMTEMPLTQVMEMEQKYLNHTTGGEVQ